MSATGPAHHQERRFRGSGDHVEERCPGRVSANGFKQIGGHFRGARHAERAGVDDGRCAFECPAGLVQRQDVHFDADRQIAQRLGLHGIPNEDGNALDATAGKVSDQRSGPAACANHRGLAALQSAIIERGGDAVDVSVEAR